MKLANEICVANYKEYSPAVRRNRNMLCKFICLPNKNFYCFRLSFLSPDTMYENTNMLILIEHVIYVFLFPAAAASLQQQHRQRQQQPPQLAPIAVAIAHPQHWRDVNERARRFTTDTPRHSGQQAALQHYLNYTKHRDVIMPRTSRGICAKFVLQAAHLGITGEFQSCLK